MLFSMGCIPMAKKINNPAKGSIHNPEENLVSSKKGRSSSIFREEIEFRMDIADDLEIETDILVPLALLLNELIINSVKYAFPDEPGIISITVSDDLKNHKIIFKDNGIGFPENRVTSSAQLGLDLVESLAAQIGGSVSFANDKGAVSTIVFPRK